MTTIILIVLAVIVIGYFVSTQRSLVSLDELCKNALSQIEVQLNSRWDAVLALAKMAAQYSKHESETLIQVIQQRRGADINSPADVNEQQNALQQVMGRLIAIGEAYPDLKAADLFRETQEGVKQYESANGPLLWLGADYLFLPEGKAIRPSASLNLGYRLAIPRASNSAEGAFLHAALGADFHLGGLSLNLSLTAELTQALRPAAGISLRILID